MSENNMSLLIKSPLLTKILSILLFIISPLLFFIIIAHFPELSFSVDVFLFVFMVAGIYLGIYLYTIGDLAESFISVLQIKNLSYKKFQLLQSKIILEYATKQFELISFSRFNLHSIFMVLHYGGEGGGFPKSHLELWVSTKSENYSTENPYLEVTRKYAYDLGELMKPHKYIQEDLEDYGKNISDLFFLGFAKRGKDKYLLAMLDWNTKPYVLAKMLDIMSEIVEKYGKE